MTNLEILISNLSGETLIDANLILETPQIMHAIKNGASYKQLIRIIDENF